MSLINYEHVGRVKTTNASNHHHHIRSASSARTRNKQRKWRVLLAIGLLLPTLAAIIGIVAWTISIEVANTSQSQPQISALTSAGLSGGGSNNYRKLQQQQQQQQETSHHHHNHHAASSKAAAAAQFRRHNAPVQAGAQANEIIADHQSSNEAKSPAAAAAVANGKSTSGISAPTAPEVEVEAAELEPASEVEAAAEAEAARASGPVAATVSGRAQVNRRRPPSQAATEAGNLPPANEKTKSESGPATKDRRSSTLLLTNLGQVETLNKSTRDQRQVLDSVAEDDGSSNSNDDDNNKSGASATSEDAANEDTGSGSEGQKSKPTQDGDEGEASATVVPPQSDSEDSSDNKSKVQEGDQGADQLPERQEQETKKQAQEADHSKAKKMRLAENVKNSSHKFLSGSSKSRKSLQKEATNNNKNPSSEVEKALGGAAEESAEQEEDETQTAAQLKAAANQRAAAAAAAVAKQTNRLFKSTVAKILLAKGLEEPSNSRYTIVNAGKDIVADEDGTSSSSSNDRSGEDVRSDTPREKVQEDREKEGFREKAEDEDRNRYVSSQAKQQQEDQQQQQRDDELSFEAIASAISTTLSANAQQSDDQPRAEEAAPANPSSQAAADMTADPEELTGDDGGSSSSVFAANDGREAASRQNQAGAAAAAATRRRTPGEHVAEVIDHIVERRKQSSGAPISGPQIVVVAPVGGSEMKARSLTREVDQPAAGGKAGGATRKVKPISEDKQQQQRVAGGSKKETVSTLTDKKPRSRTTKPLAARLLGVGSGSGDSVPTDGKSNGTKSPVSKYSERVEVIEDDDSSAFLYKNPDDNNDFGQQETFDSNNDDESNLRRRDDGSLPAQTQISDQQRPQEIDFGTDKSLVTLEQLLEDQPASIHVSNQPSQPRLRAPRNGSPIGLAFERYHMTSMDNNNRLKSSPLVSAPQLASTGGSSSSSSSGLASAGSAGPRIYSAEKLIMEHMLKAKIQPQVQAEARVDPTEDPIKRSGPNGHMQHQQQQQPKKQQHWQPQQQQQPSNPAIKQTKVAPTTVRPHHQPSSTSSSSDIAQQVVPEQNMAKEQQAPQQDSRQQPRGPTGNDQLQPTATSSNVQSIQVPIFMGPNQYQQQQQQQSIRPDTYQQHHNHRNQMQLQNHQQSPQSYQNQAPEVLQQSSSEDQQQQQQFEAAQQRPQALPTFADQEFNVPAHMAESVIQNIQMSPVSFNMVNGRPTLVGGMGQQVPPYHQLQQQQQQHYPSNIQPIYHQQQQHQYSNAMASEVQPIYQSWQPFPIVSAGANNRLQQQQQQQQQYPLNLQRQSLSDRSTKTITLSPSKGFAVHPIAQLALKHLLGSFAKQKQSRQETPADVMIAASDSTQASAKEATAMNPPPPAMGPASHVSGRSVGALEGQKIPQTQDTSASDSSSSADSMMSSASNQQQAIMNARDSMASAGTSGGLPSVQREAAVQLQQDQDMEESYGQVPTYHMAPRAPHYGGGGNHYPADEHDKKSKGITFHFGGGPIGGGTQLITSPMGIFKHLMIPLLPNPRVNLNGKVVFGVVLEKSTAIGDAPKKKYKFWGRR